MRIGTCIAITLILGFAMGQTNPPSGAQLAGQTAPATQVCLAGYTWNTQICVQCKVVTGGTCTCANYGECATLVCDSDRYQIGQACQTHPDSNCMRGGLASDGSTIVCYQCKPLYTLIGGICVTNNNCQTFDLTTGVCTKCLTSYYNTLTTLTPSQFQTLATSLTLTYSTYYQTIQQCISCLTGCDNCSSATTCQNCNNAYYLKADSTACLACTTIATQCATCNWDSAATPPSAKCQTCNSGYYLASATTCPSCSDQGTTNPKGILNCATCSISGTTLSCLTCSAGFIVSSDKTSCTACTGYPDTCSGCSSGSTCSSCSGVANSVLIGSTCTFCANCYPGSCSATTGTTPTAVCSKCNDIYYLNENGACVLCSAFKTGYLRCTYDTNAKIATPTQCSTGYFLVNNTCASAQTVNTCSLVQAPSDGTTVNTNLCQTCWPNYSQNGNTCFICNFCQSTSACTQSTTNNAQTVCSNCNAHYFFNTNSSACESCITSCNSCTGSAIADCSDCMPGYFKTSTACAACTTNGTTSTTTCAVCTDATTCTTCITGYYASGGKCLSCQAGCSTCTTPGNLCTACNTGYYLQNGGCVLDQGNCLTKQSNQANGCQMCQYGFYLTSGWLTQQGATPPVTDQVCLQCISPESAFVCRANPTEISQNPVPGTSTTVLNTSNYFRYALPTQIQGVARVTAATCKQGYFWNSQTCMPCVNINNGICTACSNFTECSTFTCNTGYYQLSYQLNNNNITSCVVLPTGCTTLTYSTTEVSLACTQCSSGYTLVGNICIQNNSCLTVSPTNGSCTECQAGYYFNWSFSFQNVINAKTAPATNANYYNYFAQFCSKCYTGCAICTSQYTCTTCSSGFYWSQSTVTAVYATPLSQNVFIPNSANAQTGTSGQCLACPANCISCTSGSTCSQCASGWYYDSTATASDALCKTCGITNCTQCPGGTCTACVAPAVVSGNSCVTPICNSPCATCGADSNTCATCPAFYIITGSTCTSCPSFCNSCSILSGTTDTTSCTQCQDGYYMVQQTNNQVTCTSCSNAGTGFLRCNGVLENPNQSGVLPFQCSDSYYLSSNACYSVGASPTCSTIQNSSTSQCAACLPNLTANGTSCALCSSSITNCIACTANNSNSGYVCSGCIQGYVLNTATNTCDKCPGGCQVCTVSGGSLPYTYSCTTCYTGNYKNTVTGACVGCPPSCATCDTKLTCTTCNNGFYMRQSTVTYTSVDTAINTQYIFKPCYPCQTGCSTCTGPNGNVCTACQTGYVLQSAGCVTLASANCYTNDPNGCTACLAGFFLDANKICQECVSPYTNFVCGLKSVTPTPTPTPTPGPTPTPSPTTPSIGVNPVQPSSYGVLIGFLIMVILQ